MPRLGGRPVADRAPLAHPGAAALAVALAAVLLLPAVAVPQPAGSKAEAVVHAFYAYHLAHDPGFTLAAVRRRSGWMSPGLLARCRAYFSRPTRPDEVPAIDGDPFTDSQEYPKAFRVGPAAVEGDTARVNVTLTWAGGDRRTVTVVLVPARGVWRIDDVRFRTGPSLRELLASQP